MPLMIVTQFSVLSSPVYAHFQ